MEDEEIEVDTIEESEKAKAWLAGQKQRPVKFDINIARQHIANDGEKENES